VRRLEKEFPLALWKPTFQTSSRICTASSSVLPRAARSSWPVWSAPPACHPQNITAPSRPIPSKTDTEFGSSAIVGTYQLEQKVSTADPDSTYATKGGTRAPGRLLRQLPGRHNCVIVGYRRRSADESGNRGCTRHDGPASAKARTKECRWLPRPRRATGAGHLMMPARKRCAHDLANTAGFGNAQRKERRFTSTVHNQNEFRLRLAPFSTARKR
jgi:hypothetical protein